MKRIAKKPVVKVDGSYSVKEYKDLLIRRLRETTDEETLIGVGSVLLPVHSSRTVKEVTKIIVESKLSHARTSRPECPPYKNSGGSRIW